MNIQVTDRKRRGTNKGILVVLLLLLLAIPAYLCYNTFLKDKYPIQQENIEKEIPEQNEEVEEEIVEEEEEVVGDPYEELLPVIEEQQAYVVVPTRIDEENPPTLILYSHGSNTNVTENMEDQFMKDLQAYGILFTQYNYIFAASNQHGVNWGNKASIQDTLNLKEWVEDSYPIEPKVYLIGFSMGGLPTMNFTTTYPELVSKIALLAPTTKTSEWNQTRTDKVMDIDIRIWHGNKDVNVPYSSVVYFVSALKKWGKDDIQFITLEGKTHFDVDTEYSTDILEFFNS
ncbi:MAG: alpha/beta fold hydrolase [Candidatus Dojkabacteria bacterium]|jgi:predicted peptidase|nr:alpha/beta fold hydrolase [Candidatus Dojkabacteria bacterium]